MPGTGFASRPRVHRAAEVDVLTRRSPPGATFIARQRSWTGQSRMARRAECSEPRSGVLDGSEQHRYQGDRVRSVPMEHRSFARATCTIRACWLKRRERLPCLPTHPVPTAGSPKPDHIDAERAANRSYPTASAGGTATNPGAGSAAARAPVFLTFGSPSDSPPRVVAPASILPIISPSRWPPASQYRSA